MMVSQPNPNDEVVKCVVVGDSGVGKTCLVCAWACNQHYDLKKLVKTHVATVWAIDHYQRDREVLERSWCEVDGVQVSLRLWDTFGYHDKDRRFAYRGADVIVLCFSTVRPSSLRNVRTIWYPEIRRFCPTTPIVLVGTQADLRYLYHEDAYLKMEKGLMYRNIHEKDIVTPAMGHDMAKEIGAPFYESSVLTKFGISDIFINSVRAALIERRKLKFWNTQLRKVQRPLIQHPRDIPTPTLPVIQLAPPSPSPSSGLASLLYEQSECDVTFEAQGVCVGAHRIILAISCTVFQDLFSCPELAAVQVRRSQERSTLMEVEPDPFRNQSVTSDDECLLDNDVNGNAASPKTNATLLTAADPDDLNDNLLMVYPLRVVHNHPAFESVEVKYRTDPYHPHRQPTLMTFVTMHSDITSAALQLIFEFLYAGKICKVADSGSAREVRRAAELLGLSNLLVGLESFTSEELYLSDQVEKKIREERQARLRTLALSPDNFLTDVVFEVDDGQVAAHKVLLMAGCEMMNAMFSNSFLESSADVVSFPDINVDTFRALVEYLYTGEATHLAAADGLSLVETANRLCLPHLVSLAEAFIVSDLQCMDTKGIDAVEEAMMLLEPAELHNAMQLAYWCEKFISAHYQEATQEHGKLFRALPRERQEAIEKTRWPPVWYLKEADRYERQMHDRLKYPEQRQRQDYNRCFSSCLCFSRRGRHRLSDPVELPI
ncbi:rho-related BTB domain-containing protein 1-like [Littorina saxatilis]|uniref:BTB domain-containing protein n=1 Tax=Littorina saxatilis TaxID=31220 RepID=A0AAN9GIB8_9CAEN